jgi:2-amino-4-hydroxy-6-hydroxymethyldihydropteridine diphosphokinase
VTPAGSTGVYLGLGSNMGDRESHLAHALHRLRAAGSITGVSTVYETDPEDHLDQPRFLNLVARVETALDPLALHRLTRAIEQERGRERSFPGAPRTLDVDILLYGDRSVRLPGLIVPHPRMAARSFVLVPLLELDAGVRDPVTGRAFADHPAARAPAGMVGYLSGEELLQQQGGP